MKNKFTLAAASLLMIGLTHAAAYRSSLSKHHFVCYQGIQKEAKGLYPKYFQFHYIGCKIQSKPCKQQTFSKHLWLTQATNAYYRCQLS